MHRQGIVVWLDKDASYSTFVDRLVERLRAAAFPCPVVGFRGSFLETLFALEPYASGYDQHALIVHMPGYTEDSIRKTPLLELYEAGTRFRKALDTVIRQAASSRVLPEEIDAYLKQKPSLEQADAWLAQSLSRKAVGLEALLDSSGKALVVEALALKGGVLAVSVTSEADAATLGQYLHRLAGMDAEWLSFAPAEPHSTPLERTRTAFSAWILCVEYVHDLRREPHVPALRRLRGLAKPLVAVCSEIASRLRQGYPAAYVELADGVEAMLDVELETMKPEDLGHIDTFREEENRMLDGNRRGG